MVEHCLEAFALIPSQVLRATTNKVLPIGTSTTVEPRTATAMVSGVCVASMTPTSKRHARKRRKGTSIQLTSWASSSTKDSSDRNNRFLALLQLVPSQLLHRSYGAGSRGKPATQLLIAAEDPSSGTKQSTTWIADMTVEGGNSPPSTDVPQQRERRRNKKRRPLKKRNTDVQVKAAGRNSTELKESFPLEGNFPDIYWRSIPMDHFRQHPNVEALPASVSRLRTVEDVRLFRQESWQWDVLHKGRCTTSQAVAALGFLEPIAGEVLKVPKSWWRGGRGAYARFREPRLETIKEMNAVLCGGDNALVESSTYNKDATTKGGNNAQSFWTMNSRQNNSTFVAEYTYRSTPDEIQTRKKLAHKLVRDENLSKTIRMAWGNTQEATALLTALNYFTKIDDGLIIEETGMCGAGLDLNHQSEIQSSLLVGATPDAILRYSDGRIEALEVKNHCPFFVKPRKVGKRSREKSKFFVGDRIFEAGKDTGGVFSHYVPQLQLEMYCLGPECRSAVMVRQTATKGALILRMHRDDEWISEMMYFLHKFQKDFVESGVPPPHNFFWEEPNGEVSSRYRRFISRTQQVRREGRCGIDSAR